MCARTTHAPARLTLPKRQRNGLAALRRTFIFCSAPPCRISSMAASARRGAINPSACRRWREVGQAGMGLWQLARPGSKACAAAGPAHACRTCIPWLTCRRSQGWPRAPTARSSSTPSSAALHTPCSASSALGHRKASLPRRRSQNLAAVLGRAGGGWAGWVGTDERHGGGQQRNACTRAQPAAEHPAAHRPCACAHSHSTGRPARHHLGVVERGLNGGVGVCLQVAACLLEGQVARAWREAPGGVQVGRVSLHTNAVLHQQAASPTCAPYL